MINKLSVNAVESSIFSNNFLKPLFASYCFTNINPTICKLFNISTDPKNLLPSDCLPSLGCYDRIILVLVDALGWSFINKFFNNDKSKALRSLADNSMISKITSQFPSTTAVHITNLYTGMPINESGICEWFYYESRINKLIAPLLSSSVYSQDLYKHSEHDFYLTDFIKDGWFFDLLNKNNINSYLFNHKDYAFSDYNKHVSKGSITKAYNTFDQGVRDCYNTFKNERGRSFYYLYTNLVDTANHKFGPESLNVENAIIQIFETLDKDLIQPIKSQADKDRTLILVTADHGGTNIDPQTTIYLDRLYPELHKFTKRDADNSPLFPCGSPRDIFLHIEEESIDRAFTDISTLLESRAEVYKTKDVLNTLFQKPYSEDFLKNIGNIIILPKQSQSVFFLGDKGQFKHSYLGNHGGLTRDEMEIPFIACEL